MINKMNILSFKMDDDYYIAIGKITVRFSVLEESIGFLIGHLLNTDKDTSNIVTSELSFKNQLGLFSSLVINKFNYPSVLQRLKLLRKEIEDVETKRNLIMHSMWYEGDTKETVTRFKRTSKLSKGLQYQIENISLADLAEIFNEIESAIDNVFDFFFYAHEEKDKIGKSSD